MLFTSVLLIIVGIAVFRHNAGGKKPLPIYPINSGTQKLQIASNERTDVLGNVNYAWDNIELGDQYVKSGDYDSAVEAYKKAYSVKVANRSVSGIILAETYEKLARYDEGIQIINDMIKDNVLNENGITRVNEIKYRLLAAKSQALHTEQSAQAS